MDQLKVIKESTRAFIVKINQATSPTLTHRYQVYIEYKGSVFPLFGKKKIKYQVEHPINRALPKFHFALKGASRENLIKLSDTLREINPQLPIHYLNGY